MSRVRKLKSSLWLAVQFTATPALLLLALAGGCGRTEPVEPEPNPPDTELSPPGIASVTPGEGSFLSGTVSFDIQAARAESLEIRLTAVPVALGTTSPLTWDTRSVANGDHSLVVEARNAAGIAQKRFRVYVDNVGNGVVIYLHGDVTQLDAGQSTTLRATVLGAADKQVSWSLPGGPATGSINADGVYTAPTTIGDDLAAVIQATSVADPEIHQTYTITVKPGPGVPVIELTPATAMVLIGTTKQLTVHVTNSTSTGIQWELPGVGTGIITPTGLYHAPDVLPTNTSVTVTARSLTHPSSFASTHIDLRDLIPANEAEALSPLMMSGFQCATIGDQLVELAADILNAAYRANGNRVATSGTVTRSGSGWSIVDANAGGNLVVELPGQRYEMTVDRVAGVPFATLAPWQHRSLLGSLVVGRIKCRLASGELDVTIDHLSSTGTDGITFDRRLAGTLAPGPMRAIDITHKGTFGGEVAHRGYTSHLVQGSATTGEGYAMTVDADMDFGFFETCYAQNGSYHEDWDYVLNNTLQLGPFRLALAGNVNGGVDGCGYSRNSWSSSAAITRNGAPYAEIESNGGAEPVMDVNDRYIAPLLPMELRGRPVIETLVENPLQAFSVP